MFFAASLELQENDFDRIVGFEPVGFFVDFVDLYNPVAGSFAVSGFDERPDSLLKRTAALVLEDSYHLTPKLTLNAGTRLEYVDYDYEQLNFDGSVRRNDSDHLTQAGYSLGVSYNAFGNTYVYARHDQRTG